MGEERSEVLVGEGKGEGCLAVSAPSSDCAICAAAVSRCWLDCGWMGSMELNAVDGWQGLRVGSASGG